MEITTDDLNKPRDVRMIMKSFDYPKLKKIKESYGHNFAGGIRVSRIL